eukprot:EC721894.1.p1 GENE.EC721894.1~~EC721894.1.p1  ORF type:complete len:98 (+),score=18.95 EC721894.1:22-315(+)
MSLARVGRFLSAVRCNARSFASAAPSATGKSSYAVQKFPVEEQDGIYMREVDGKWVQCNQDGVICAEMEASLDFVLPSPPPYHTFAEVPIVKESPSE